MITEVEKDCKKLLLPDIQKTEVAEVRDIFLVLNDIIQKITDLITGAWYK
jgi:hypothetical protein